MSFNMLIVDDEPVICRGLENTIQWEQHNVKVVDTAHDGEDAIEKIQRHAHVDIVITDVKMPNVDGLQLASFLHERYPQIRMIVISGYDEFAYAQKAIQLGVKDYLLKPVNVEELVQKVRGLTREIADERKLRAEFRETSLKNAIFQQIADVPVRCPHPFRACEDVKIYPFISVLQEYMQKMKHLSDDKINVQKMRWKNLIDTTLNQNGFESVSVFTGENVLLTCVKVENEDRFPKKIVSLLKQDWLTFIWSDEVIHLARLKAKMTELTRAINYLPLVEDGEIVLSKFERERRRVPTYPYDLEKKFVDEFLQFGSAGLRDLSDELFRYFRSHKFFLEEVVQVCREILIKVINQYGPLLGDNVYPLDVQYKQFVDVQLYNSYRLLQELFDDDVMAITSKLDEKKEDQKNWMIERAEAYIQEYYTSNIKAYEVADVINVSPNYFSYLFKQKTGKKFNEYVNQLRVEEAKSLLVETPFKVSEISEQVGFQEYKYFAEVFKKFTGITPTAYRHLMSKNERVKQGGT
jgi:two-component system response regulator YesN